MAVGMPAQTAVRAGKISERACQTPRIVESVARHDAKVVVFCGSGADMDEGGEAYVRMRHLPGDAHFVSKARQSGEGDLTSTGTLVRTPHRCSSRGGGDSRTIVV